MRFRLLSMLLALAALSTGVAFADGLRDREVLACSGDAMRLCSESIPDEGRVATCMTAKVTQLSANCRAFFVKTNARAD